MEIGITLAAQQLASMSAKVWFAFGYWTIEKISCSAVKARTEKIGVDNLLVISGFKKKLHPLFTGFFVFRLSGRSTFNTVQRLKWSQPKGLSNRAIGQPGRKL
ncbi:hypothetical protein [Polaromonas sp. CG_9.11]|uniref:hypothetical protein n=1 Tax=Polaromonas sp. CG_9.11 TaxID=2787730 RepID=UPI0018CA722B|nr:hypothetical protein [Polaromonas sp. CG_9.11]MBG6075424.1 hypothetical protein [Polaromonas sp. CG_9.11]